MREPEAAWPLIVAAVTQTEASLNKWLTQNHGVGLTEYRAVALLCKAPDHELRITELATQVGLNQSSATRLVGRLETKGLAVRDTCPDDGRGVYAVVTDQGSTLVRDLAGPYADRLTTLLKDYARQEPGVDARIMREAFRSAGDLIS